MPVVSNSTRAFCKKNLVSTDLMDVSEPWLNTSPIPAFANKAQYRQWCSHPATEHVFFTLAEGEIPGLPTGIANKPARIHGFCADFDTTGVQPADFERALRRANPEFMPYAWNITFSGGIRMVWLFAEPIFHYGNANYKRFVKRLVRELKVNSIFPGLDDTSEQAGHYFTAGTGWTVNPHKPLVRAAALHLWLAETAKADDFDAGVEIPLDIVAAQVEKRFPNRWAGDFVEGARGVRFWDAGADATASIVRKNGVQCFTGPSPFMTWEAIFGREFVQQYLEDRMGGAIRDLFYDGKNYFRQLHDESFDQMNTEVTKRHMAVQYGLCPKTQKDDNESECDRALHRIEMTKRIAGALPFPHQPERLVHFNGGTYLNIANTRLWPAAFDEQEWGENFPWISSYLATLFDTQEHLEVFLSWLHVWLKSCHDGSPRKGHAMFIVGPPNTGKTLLSTQIIARMFGGATEATQYIVEGNKYNDALFEKALWVVDDAIAGGDTKTHNKFSALIKAAVANGTFRYERKYGKSLDVPFNGRIMVSLNDDPESLTILPNTDLSLLDKVILIPTGDMPADVAMDVRERYEVIERELSSFVRWLLDFEIPSWIEKDARFGIKAYHAEGILQDAREVTASASILEIIGLWKIQCAADYEKNPVGERDQWVGTPTELLQALRNCPPTAHAVSRMTSAWLGRHVNQAIANGTPGFSRSRRGGDSTRVLVIKLR